MATGQHLDSCVGKFEGQNIYDLMKKRRGARAFEQEDWVLEIPHPSDVIFMAIDHITRP